MIHVRPARPADLDQIEQLAAAARPLLHSLPADRDTLRDKLALSARTFAGDASAPDDELYSFVLEQSSTGRLLGIASIVAAAGRAEPFYTYRNEVIVHASRELRIHHRVHALTLCHELTGNTQLSGFCISAELSRTEIPALLSRARLLFIANHPERFTEDLFAVLPGVSDEDGRSPFWENVGHKFFGLEFRQAEFLSGGRNKTFIAELMPHHPLYVPLLSEDAQAVMGQLHPQSTLPFSLLAEEGFESDRFVDIFDAGPVMTVKRELCRSIRESHRRGVTIGDAPAFADEADHRLYLVCNASVERFRALALALPQDLPDPLTLDAQAAALLEVEEGDTLRCAALHPDRA